MTAIEILTRELTLRRNRNARYSLRAFAKSLGVSHALLSMVMSGKRAFSSKLAVCLIQRLELSPQESKIILQAARLSDSPRTYKKIDLEQFNLISDWAHHAILSLFETKDAKFDTHWIAQRLNIKEPRAQACLENLVTLGYLTNKSGRWQQSGGFIKMQNQVSTALTRSFNESILTKAVESMKNDPVEIRNLSSTTFALDPEHLPLAVQRIRDFRRKLAKEFGIRGEPKEVYNIAIQLFPLSHTQESEI